MTFGASMTRAPRVFDLDAGQSAWEKVSLSSEFKQLIVGSAGSSAFLRDLIERESDWLAGALLGDPADVFDQVIKSVAALAVADLKAGLRTARRRVALFVGLADLAGVWPLETITDALTRFADIAVERAFGAATRRERERGKLEGLVKDRPMYGLAVLAMGKMGAFELNYSSDIDLIVLIDETAIDPEAFNAVRPAYVRATRNAVAMLTEITADGFVFRTDLRLRPDPAVTPVALSMAAAERYYESLGRTWERAAYIKARTCAGDIEAGDTFLKRLSPFIWRRHLDFAALRDAHDMRLKIQSHKRIAGLPAYQGRDLKLGPGGIREIEFFTQTRQIIAGGRDPSLRRKATVDGLKALAAKGWVEKGDTETLIDDYRSLREAEHRIQMIADQQTHQVPVSDDAFQRFACLMDMDKEELGENIVSRGARVEAIAEGFFAPSKPAQVSPAMESPILEKWPSYPALRSQRAVQIFERVKPTFLKRISEASQPGRVLDHFDGLLSRLPAGVQLFSLFESNPQLVDLIVDICDTAPDLAEYLSQNAAVLDAVIAGGFFDEWPGLEAVEADLMAAAVAARDYESELIALREVRREWHFRVGVHHLRGMVDGEVAGHCYADIAEAVVRVLWPRVIAEFSRRHGPPPGNGAALVAMGSLGARRLHADSDLDLIVIYDAAPTDMSHGEKPLAAQTYFGRLTKALMTALSAQMPGGRLYEVDMRLRPSGRQGPVATTLPSFRNYQANEAWIWEHLALTRARVIAGGAALSRGIENVRREVLSQSKPKDQVLRAVAEMRDRLEQSQPGGGDFETRSGQGRLRDLELLAQAASYISDEEPPTALGEQLSFLPVLGLDAPTTKRLIEHQSRLWSLRAVRYLAGMGATADPENISGGLERFVLRETGSASLGALIQDLRIESAATADVVKTVLGEAGSPA